MQVNSGTEIPSLDRDSEYTVIVMIRVGEISEPKPALLGRGDTNTCTRGDKQPMCSFFKAQESLKYN